MEWLSIVEEIFKVCVVPLLGVLTAYAVQFIKVKIAKINEQSDNELLKKYTEMLGETIINCVLATNQTYVDALKKEDKFDLEAQKTAFNMTKTAVLSVLSQDAQKYLTSIYGDLNVYISNRIEAEIKKNKKISE